MQNLLLATPFYLRWEGGGSTCDKSIMPNFIFDINLFVKYKFNTLLQFLQFEIWIDYFWGTILDTGKQNGHNVILEKSLDEIWKYYKAIGNLKYCFLWIDDNLLSQLWCIILF